MKAPERIDQKHWHWPDREWLEHQHFTLGKPYRLIAIELSTNKDNVQRWAKCLGVSVWNVIPKDGIHPPIKVGDGNGVRFPGVTREWLVEEYIRKDKSAKQIADGIGSSHNAIITWLKEHGIPLRDREAMNERHAIRMSGDGNPAWSGGTARNYQHRALVKSGRPQVCEWCGTTEDIQMHHRDHNKANGDLSNLAWLCGPCNRAEAHLWILQQDRKANILVDLENHKIEIHFNTPIGGK